MSNTRFLTAGFDQIKGSEDCLYLNVFVPGGVKPDARMPVMVWIHGGGYMIESSAAFEGSVLALNGDVIVVSMNYRLGVLGFLHDGPGIRCYFFKKCC